jgi:site-specific recombinase XerD
MINVSIVWDYRRRTEKGQEGPLEIRITANRKPYYINTGVRVREREFVGGSVVGRVDAPELNKRLTVLYNRVNDEVTKCIEESRAIDVAEIKSRVWLLAEYQEKDETTFVDWIEEQEPLLGLKADTLKHYKTLRMRLREFGGILRWQDINVENIVRFDAWLHNLQKKQTKAREVAGLPVANISDGAVYNYHKTLKRMINHAVMMGRMDRNPYDRLRGRFKRGDKENVEYLTEDEMRLVMDLHPVVGSDIAKARDLFVFQMLTGMSYSDAQAFDIKNYKQVDGKWVTAGERIKTGAQFISQLLPPVVDVLERNGWKVPKLTNQKYNGLLKTIGATIGIERMHSHLARHTFATYFLSKDTRIEHVQKMLGHKDIKTTQRYAKVLAKDVHDDFDRVGMTLVDDL